MQQNQEIKLQDYIVILIRRKWIILFTFLAIFLPVLYHTSKIPPIYKATSRLVIEAQPYDYQSWRRGMNLIYSPSGQPLVLTHPVGYYREIINSQMYLKEVANEFRKIERNSTLTQEQAISLIAGKIQLDIDENTGIMSLSVQATNPQTTLDIASAATIAFRNRCTTLEQEEMQNVTNFIETQLATVRNNLEDAEQKLQIFRERTNVISIDNDKGIPEEYTNLLSAYNTTKAEREIVQANLRSKKAQLERENKNLVPTLNDNSSSIQQLRDELLRLEQQRRLLKENSPEIALLDKQMKELENKIIQAVIIGAEQTMPIDYRNRISAWQKLQKEVVQAELDAEILASREQYYKGMIDNFKKNHPTMLDDALEYLRLARTKQFHEERYKILLESFEQARLSLVSRSGGIKIIDEPVFPTSPIPTKKTQKVLFASLIGLVIGISIAFMREYMDTSFRSAEDIIKTLQIPVMGIIPSIGKQYKRYTKKHKTGFALPQMNVKKYLPSSITPGFDTIYSSKILFEIEPKHPVAEAYRSLRTNLRLAVSYKGGQNFVQTSNGKVLLISSSGPQEGKTLTSVNLAISYAQMGDKVLLVDADMRCPNIDKLLNLPRENGLADLLTNSELNFKDVIRDTKNENLKVITSGTDVMNPAELIDSPRMNMLLDNLKTEFDIIIVDTPPIVGVSDTAILCSKVDEVLLVVKSNATSKEVAHHAKDLLEKAHSNVIGAVLNDVDVSNKYGSYGYYSYYHKYYKRYYNN